MQQKVYLLTYLDWLINLIPPAVPRKAPAAYGGGGGAGSPSGDVIPTSQPPNSSSSRRVSTD